MLYLALVQSAVLVGLMCFAARSPRRWPVMVAAVAGAAVPVAAMCTGFATPVVMLNVGLLVVVAVVWQFKRRPGWAMLAMSFAATAAAYGYGCYGVRGRMNEAITLRDKYPFESLAARMPPAPTGPAMCSEKELREFENDVGLAMTRNLHHDAIDLEQVHGNAVRNFVAAWGFGVGRMPYFDVPHHVNPHEPTPAPPQPANPTYDAADGPVVMNPWDRERMVRDALVDFVHPTGFGLFRDREHVAGFRPHRFSRMPTQSTSSERVGDTWVASKRTWEVARLELVSLLMHAEPGVYVSDRLPQMDALKGVPTRPLDEFEADGLAKLRKGDDLVASGNRMLGSIRNAKQCIACHGGDRGALLGAFTYTLRAVK